MDRPHNHYSKSGSSSSSLSSSASKSSRLGRPMPPIPGIPGIPPMPGIPGIPPPMPPRPPIWDIICSKSPPPASSSDSSSSLHLLKSTLNQCIFVFSFNKRSQYGPDSFFLQGKFNHSISDGIFGFFWINLLEEFYFYFMVFFLRSTISCKL